MNNYFRVLGVKSNASENDIKKPIDGCRTSTTPTSCTGRAKKRKEQAAARLHQVKQAYEVLSDPKQRAAFIKDFNNVIVTDPAAAMQEMWDQFYP